MFHHEAGKLFSDIDRRVFDNSIRLAEDVIKGLEVDPVDYM
jgi:hypothetical protein